jgi:hypothetical protein
VFPGNHREVLIDEGAGILHGFFLFFASGGDQDYLVLSDGPWHGGGEILWYRTMESSDQFHELNVSYDNGLYDTSATYRVTILYRSTD